LKNTETTFPVK